MSGGNLSANISTDYYARVMNNELKNWVKLCSNYGFINGCQLFTNLKTKRVGKLRVGKMSPSVFLRPDTSDIPTFHQIFTDAEYDINLPFVPRNIIDGGANIGLAAIYLKSRFPEAKIVCVEPDKENFEVLKKNLVNIEDTILLEGALWNSKTRLSISDKFDSGKWGMVTEEIKDEDSGSESVETFTIDEIMKIAEIDRIDLLKLDIETAEKELFSKNYQSWLPKTKAIVIELHDGMKKGCSKTFFSAANECFGDYSFTSRGESAILINENFQ